MKEGVAAERADGQRHQEREQKLEEDVAHQWDEDDAEQRQQADDGDGDEAADPRCRSQTQHVNQHRPPTTQTLTLGQMWSHLS